MDLVDLTFYIAVYLGLGFLFNVMLMGTTDGDLDDFLFMFLILWPIALVVASIVQLIRFIRFIFRGEY